MVVRFARAGEDDVGGASPPGASGLIGGSEGFWPVMIANLSTVRGNRAVEPFDSRRVDIQRPRAKLTHIMGDGALDGRPRQNPMFTGWLQCGATSVAKIQAFWKPCGEMMRQQIAYFPATVFY